MPENQINIKQVANLENELNKSLSDVLSVGNTASNNILMGTYSIGINTVAPDVELHIVGEFKLDDGTANTGYVLTAVDGTGLATWTASSGGGGVS